MTLQDESFETFDADGNPSGLAPRSRVHREGLWHRATNVFLFRSDGRLVVQRRQRDKDVCPSAWDLSVAEHLQPGETYEQGALRGLKEELGVEGVAVDPIGEEQRARFEISATGLRDYELQQSFRAVFDGELRPDPGEVAEIGLWRLGDLKRAFDARPADFTPWFRDTAARLGFV